MSLLTLKKRPLERDIAHYRDDRLLIIACDDTYAPKQYFGFFQLPRVQIHVVETLDGSSVAQHVLSRLLQYDHEEDDERWLLIDTDHCIKGEHLKGFLQAISEAKQRGIKIAVSRSCFEIWLLLHYVEEANIKDLKNAAETEQALKNALGSYNKKKLKLTDFPIESVKNACIRAEELDKKTTGGDIPDQNASRVYLVWKSIVSKLPLSSKLYSELSSILN